MGLRELQIKNIYGTLKSIMNIVIIIYLSIIYFLSEFLLMLSKRSKNKKESVKTKSDKRSLLLLWITMIFTITEAFYNANWQTWNQTNIILAYLGVLILLIGAVVRWVAIFQLNKEFTVDVSISENHKLKTDGLYKNLRHPSYLGLYLICIGLSIGMNSILSFLIISIPLFAALLYRIKIEENVLTNEFGNLYLNYKNETKKIFPGIF